MITALLVFLLVALIASVIMFVTTVDRGDEVTALACGLLLLCSGSMMLGVVVSSYTLEFKDDKIECEKNLPRNLVCKPFIGFEVVEKQRD